MTARTITSAALLLLFAAHFALCMKPRKEDLEACTKEATESSSVSEEDKTKALEIFHQARREMHRMFREKKEEELREMKKKDFVSEKVQASEDIKDKEAAVKFVKAFSHCLMGQSISWERIRCQKAKDANKDRLSDEDLKKLMIAAKQVKMDSEGKIADEELEKKLAEVLDSEEKRKAAMEVHKALNECMTEWKAKKAARTEAAQE
ncbi:hypothetical protein HPB49_014727 [Dermacentor silvarum]|uniref:Uncharacterized protein n=1 Tax=Dermacentor silvarum TaxID=543639 RepID=A0ACB8CXM9_DERSI|nr:hypothetical protein HPB49_014727 [Dermacentor silvarum]